MTREIRNEIERIMEEVAGVEDVWTEEMCDEVCDRCPYCGRCGEMGIMWGCPNWEESMGEEL